MKLRDTLSERNLDILKSECTIASIHLSFDGVPQLLVIFNNQAKTKDLKCTIRLFI